MLDDRTRKYERDSSHYAISNRLIPEFFHLVARKRRAVRRVTSRVHHDFPH